MLLHFLSAFPCRSRVRRIGSYSSWLRKLRSSLHGTDILHASIRRSHLLEPISCRNRPVVSTAFTVDRHTSYTPFVLRPRLSRLATRSAAPILVASAAPRRRLALLCAMSCHYADSRS